MTPFVEDILTGFSFFYEAAVKIYCYVFGHKWGEWENCYGHSPIGVIRQCDRCAEFDHDNQRLKAKGAKQ